MQVLSENREKMLSRETVTGQIEVPLSVAPAAPWQILKEVTSPGAYVRHGTGDLIRIAPSGAHDEDLHARLGSDAATVYVLRISDDPFVRITRARMAAANLDVEVSF